MKRVLGSLSIDVHTKRILAPAARYVMHTLGGVLICFLVCFAFWLAFPGAYRLGLFVGHDVLGWNVPCDIGDPAATILTWFLGLVLIVGPFVFAPLSRRLFSRSES